MILIACATKPPSPVQPGPGILAQNETKARALACSEFDPVTYSNGKPGLTVGDIAEALKDSGDPIGKVRNLVGDTRTTKGQIDVYMAERQKLCPK